MTAIEYLDQQVKQLAPTAEGISIGRWDDSSTWKVSGAVTDTQLQSIISVFKAFNKKTFEAAQVPSDIDSRLTALETRVAATELTIGEISLPKIG